MINASTQGRIASSRANNCSPTFSGRGATVLGIVPLVLAGQTGIRDIARLEVRRRVEKVEWQQAVGRAALRRQALPQFVGFAVIARRSQGVQRAGAECGEIIHDGPGRTGTPADGDHLVRAFAGFDARLGDPGVDFEIFVEKEIAEDGNSPRRKAGQQFFESLGLQADDLTSRRSRAKDNRTGRGSRGNRG